MPGVKSAKSSSASTGAPRAASIHRPDVLRHILAPAVALVLDDPPVGERSTTASWWRAALHGDADEPLVGARNQSCSAYCAGRASASGGTPNASASPTIVNPRRAHQPRAQEVRPSPR